VTVVGLTAGCETSKTAFLGGCRRQSDVATPNKSLSLPSHRAGQGLARRAKPLSAKGTSVNAFARDLNHPRWVFVLPNGDVLVPETAAPPQPDDQQGLQGMDH